MNYRKMKWLLLPLVSMFMVWWLSSVWIHMLYAQDDIARAEVLSSTGTGYNFMKAQILFALMFVVTLFQLMPELGIQQIIKSSRTSWILKKVRYTFISAVYFAAVFILVEVILAVVYVGLDFLISYNYFWCMLLEWLALTFIYLFMGCIYLLFSVLFSSGIEALGASFLVTLVFMAMSFYRGVPTVYLTMSVMQMPIAEKIGLESIEPMSVVKPLVYNLVAMLLMIFVAVQVFKRKDLLDSRLHLI